LLTPSTEISSIDLSKLRNKTLHETFPTLTRPYNINVSKDQTTMSNNITDRCAIGGASISITACCSQYANDSSVHNYLGGTAGESCYYYCSFNGTVEDMREVMACQSGAAAQMKRDKGGSASGYIGIGSHPDLSEKSSAVFEVPKLGVWRWVVLGLAFFGAMAGTL
jgi:hypothetical protein